MRPSRPRARAVVRWGGRIAALLALGVATSIGVAWACGAALVGTARQRMVIVQQDDGRARGAVGWSTLGVEFVLSMPGLESAEVMANYAPSDDMVVRRETGAWWFDGLPKAELTAAMPARMFAMQGAGLPFICVATPLENTLSTGTTTVLKGVKVGKPSREGIERVLPYGPVWRGLALNTLFYGALWFALGATFVAVRSARRRRRNLCPACAFSLAGAAQPGCPECGWGRA